MAQNRLSPGKVPTHAVLGARLCAGTNVPRDPGMQSNFDDARTANKLPSWQLRPYVSCWNVEFCVNQSQNTYEKQELFRQADPDCPTLEAVPLDSRSFERRSAEQSSTGRARHTSSSYPGVPHRHACGFEFLVCSSQANPQQRSRSADNQHRYRMLNDSVTNTEHKSDVGPVHVPREAARPLFPKRVASSRHSKSAWPAPTALQPHSASTANNVQKEPVA